MSGSGVRIGSLVAAIAAAALLPSGAAAQVLSCSVPRAIPRPHADLPSASQPARRLPIGGYTLAISWSPQFCRTRSGAGRSGEGSAFQCGRDNRFGFVLHGLWPDGVGREWPQYCAAAPLLSRATIARNICTTPSAQLMQHEWAKHGTCMAGMTPDRFFATSGAMFRRLRYPDMDALSRRPTLTAGALAESIAAENPGLRADGIRVTATRDGWLDELWLCLDRARAYTRCASHAGGTDPASRIRIWRGHR